MMKILFALLVLSYPFCSNAQISNNQAIKKFDQFYSTDAVDSIYFLFSPQMKAAINLEKTKQLISTLKGQLGNITGTREVTAKDAELSDFRLSFDKPIVEMSIMVQNDLIAGIRQIALEPDHKDSAQLNSADNFIINNSIGNIYGTLVIPEKKGKVPVILLISGSGPTDRNMNQGSSLRTNSFYMLAKELSLMGIATLRYDKRGIGKSMSAHNSADASLDDFISDANLFINKLKADPRFSSVIVLGHSEGAAIGLISSLQTHPAAYISLCGYANDMSVILRSQLKTAINTNDYEIASQVLDSMQLGKTVKKQLPGSLAGLFSLPNQKFIISTLKYNSSIEIAKLKIPAFIIEGTTDLQVSERDARQLAAANSKAQLKILQGMNHILKIAPADRALNIQTYDNKDLPIDPELAKSIAGFVNKIQ